MCHIGQYGMNRETRFVDSAALLHVGESWLPRLFAMPKRVSARIQDHFVELSDSRRRKVTYGIVFEMVNRMVPAGLVTVHRGRSPVNGYPPRPRTRRPFAGNGSIETLAIVTRRQAQSAQIIGDSKPAGTRAGAKAMVLPIDTSACRTRR
jgi:hypothetical protein